MWDNQQSADGATNTAAPLTKPLAHRRRDGMADSNPTSRHRKVCFKCSVEKPMREFYRHPEMADGHLGKCKECTKADARKNWTENSYVLRQTDAIRRRAKRASDAANNAVRDGRLGPGHQCHYCGSQDRLEKHHWDYYRPLDIWWLCKRCHRIADMARRDAETRVLDNQNKEATHGSQ